MKREERSDNGAIHHVQRTDGIIQWLRDHHSQRDGNPRMTILPVNQGGTGAATLTGLIKGNGTSPLTPAVSGTDFDRAHWVNVLDYGADPTGVSDSSTAILDAIAALPADGGWVYAPSGTYKHSSTLAFTQFQRLRGDGNGVTTFNYTGSSAAITATISGMFAGAPTPCGFEGFSINGSLAGTGAIGMQIGNLIGSYANDITIANFSTAGGIGLYFLNSGSNWCEENRFTGITLINCSTHVTFSTGSFDYSVYEFQIEANGGQNGVTVETAAQIVGCRFAIRGNFYGHATSNSAWVFAIDPGNTSGISFVQFAEFDIAVECDGTSGYVGPFTIVMGSTSPTSQLTGIGVLAFINTSVNFQGVSIANGCIFGVSGLINDTTLGNMIAGDAFAFQGGTQWALSYSGSYYSNMDIYPQFGDFLQIQLVSGTNTISAFSGAPYKRVRKLEILLLQPASGAAGTVTWPANVYWSGASHALSSTNGYIDKARLTYFPTQNAWYGEIIQHYA
jgi:Pectate lyase superfamily protein